MDVQTATGCGEAVRGQALRGEAGGGEAARGEAARGEAARGEAARGEAARGEAARGEAACAAAGRGTVARTGRWWRAWRARFGLAEVCGTVAAVAGFAAGYLPSRSLLAAGGLATLAEFIGFYGCVGAKTAVAACRATAHLAGARRVVAAVWHAITQQLASCAVAEALDFILIRPGCVAGAAWLLLPLPGGVWLGLLTGKAVADVVWYGAEATVRRGLAGPTTPEPARIGRTPAPPPRHAARWASDRSRPGEPLAGGL